MWAHCAGFRVPALDKQSCVARTNGTSTANVCHTALCGDMSACLAAVARKIFASSVRRPCTGTGSALAGSFENQLENAVRFIASSSRESNSDSFIRIAVACHDDFQLFSLQMNDKLSSLQLFVRIAHTSSFTKAGREVGLSQPSASRRISELEKEVGAALFVRSTRAVTLTETGIDDLTR